MNKLVRYWNQNRGKIILTIAIIAFIIILIQITNSILQNAETKRKSAETIDKSKPTQSVITGETVTEEETDENIGVIKEFVDFCNNHQYESAYSLLTEDCKNEFNNDSNTFVSNYCNNVFGTKRTYSLELWINMRNDFTYKITYYEDDLLATGGSNLNKNIEDYITIIQENDENKISINGFIKEQTIDKSQMIDNIEITVNSKKIYKNYETYNITIRNYTNKTILLSEAQDNKDICLVSTNDVKYPSFIEEIPFNNLSLKSGYEKNINIKFNKMYDAYRTIEKVEFNNIILDKDKYMPNSNNEIEKVQISIEI